MPLSWKSRKSGGKSGNFEKKEDSQGKVREFDRLSERKSVTTTEDQLDNLSFCHNALSRSHGKFSEVRDKSGKSQGKRKSKKVGTLLHWYVARALNSDKFVT